ncbi:MAG: hypothetical protein L0215_16865 [Gemmataceae bacterium]|nr:hypothetical protein [Gemmataceae bacterium]
MILSQNALPLPHVFGEPQLHTDGDVLAVAFAPDGSLWSVEEPGVLRNWSVVNGTQNSWQSLSEFETLWAFSRDGRVLASGSNDLAFWDVTSGQILTAFPQNTWVTALGFAPDSGFIATGHDDGAVRYWDAAGHVLLHEFRLHRRPISAVAISHDGKVVAAACEDKIINLWDLASGKHLGSMKGHTDRIPALVWHPGGEMLISAGWDTSARIWNVKNLESELILNYHATQVTALALSADGVLLASADSAPVVHIWDFVHRKLLHQIRGLEGEIRCLALARDGRTLALGGERIIHLWDPITGKALAGVGPRGQAQARLAVSPDGSRLATNGGGTAARVWNLASHQVVCRLPDEAGVHGLAFSPDGKLIAGAAETHVRLWDASTGQIRSDLYGPEEQTTAVAFSRDGQILASASNSGTGVWIWRVADGEPVLLIPDALDGCTIQSVAFHPDGRRLAVGGIDWLATGGSSGAICLWDVVERCEVATFAVGATCVAFHPSGSRLASASPDQSLCVWDVEEKTLLSEWAAHDNAITALCFSPDGQVLASGGEDRSIRLWTADGEELSVFEVDSQINALAFSPDGQYLFSANANTTCYQVRVKDLLTK